MRLVRTIGFTDDVTIVGSPELFQAFTSHLTKPRYETPLQIVRGLHAGTAPDRLISFPELLGGEGPSSVSVDVDGHSCRFSAIDARLVYAGYSVFCLPMRKRFRPRGLVDLTGMLRAKENEAEIIDEINRTLGVGLVSRWRDHLYPSIVKQKTAEGLAMGIADHARDMIGIIRLICATPGSPSLPRELIKALSGLSRMEVQDGSDTQNA